jgi:hypothetical protein
MEFGLDAKIPFQDLGFARPDLVFGNAGMVEMAGSDGSSEMIRGQGKQKSMDPIVIFWLMRR